MRRLNLTATRPGTGPAERAAPRFGRMGMGFGNGPAAAAAEAYAPKAYTRDTYTQDPYVQSQPAAPQPSYGQASHAHTGYQHAGYPPPNYPVPARIPSTALVVTRQGEVRRRPIPRWTRHALLFGVFGGGLALLVAGTLALQRSGVLEVIQVGLDRAVVQTTDFLGLNIQEVLVEGRDETSAAQLMAALDLTRGMPILGFSPSEAKARLEKLPWVRSATVERSLPDTVRVVVQEREPLALWQNQGRLALVDTTGMSIRIAEVGRYRDLPIVVGPDAPQTAPALLALVAAEPALSKRLTAAVRVSGRRWNLRFDDKVEVKLPAEDPGGALARLAGMERDHGILKRDIMAVDMRMPDRLVVRLMPGAVVKRGRPPEKAT